MSEKKKVLLAGESWMSFTTHVKGFDTFYTSVYETGEKFLKAALEEGGLTLGLEVAADLAADLLGDALSDLF